LNAVRTVTCADEPLHGRVDAMKARHYPGCSDRGFCLPERLACYGYRARPRWEAGLDLDRLNLQ